MTVRRIPLRGVALIVGLLAPGIGCSFNTGGFSAPATDTSRPESGGRDGGSPSDRPLEAAPLDGQWPDGPKAERSTMDRSTTVERPHDLARPADHPKPDLPKPKPDLPKPDLKPPLDLPPPPACASGAPVFSFQATMVICSGAGSNQCNAGKACNAAGGWHLCKASEYLARGGKGGKPPGASWIASCIRSGGAPQAPTDAVCSSCVQSTGTHAFVDWLCNPSTGTWTNADVIGVVARNECNSVGVRKPENEGEWSMSFSWTAHTQSVCCK